MATDIPRARQLIALARMVTGNPEVGRLLDEALPLMTRKLSKPPAKSTARKVTSEIVVEVLLYVDQHPDMSNRDVGAVFGIDGGRVSEIRNGLRTPENPALHADGLNESIREAMDAS